MNQGHSRTNSIGQQNQYITPQKRSDYFPQEQNVSSMKKKEGNQNEPYVPIPKKQSLDHVALQNNNIDDVHKFPTTFSFNQEGQFITAKPFQESSKALDSSLQLKVPQISQFKGDPQELVNILSGRVYSLVDQIHKLSSIIDEMTGSQQTLSEKYVELRSIYYQLLLDSNVMPSDEDKRWSILNSEPENSYKTAEEIKRNNLPTSPRNQQIPIQVQPLSPKVAGIKSPQNKNTVKLVERSGDLDGFTNQTIDEILENNQEKVKKSRKVTNDQLHPNQNQLDTQKFICKNCELRQQEEYILRTEIQQLKNNLESAQGQIHRMNSILERQKQEIPNGIKSSPPMLIADYQQQIASPKNQILSPSNNSGLERGMSLKDTMDAIKGYITDQVEQQSKKIKSPSHQSLQSPVRLSSRQQQTPSSTKNTPIKNKIQENPNYNFNNFNPTYIPNTSNSNSKNKNYNTPKNVQIEIKPN